MTRQRQISARIDNATMGGLETLSLAFGLKKNRVLNEALHYYVQLMQAVDAVGANSRAVEVIQRRQLLSIQRFIDAENVYTNREANRQPPSENKETKTNGKQRK